MHQVMPSGAARWKGDSGDGKQPLQGLLDGLLGCPSCLGGAVREHVLGRGAVVAARSGQELIPRERLAKHELSPSTAPQFFQMSGQ